MRDLRMRTWAGVLGIVSSLLVSGMLVVALPADDIGKEYTPHSTIYIFGNEDFSTVNGVTGGNGTYADPYIIEGWEIEAKQASGIVIRETSAFFVIRNVYVHSSGSSYYGLSLKNIVNGRVDNCNITNNWKGVNIRESSDVSIVGNEISFNQEGLSARDSSNVTIEGNAISFNLPQSGMVLISVSNVTIQGNIISNNNWMGLSLYSSTNVTIAGNDITSNQYEGVRILSSATVILTANTISYNSDGVRLDSSSWVTISGIHTSFNRLHGIRLESSSHVTVELSYSAVNDEHGLFVWNSSWVNVSRTTFNSNSLGTSLFLSSNITFAECVTRNNPIGVYMEASTNVSISGSDVSDNWVHGIVSWNSTNLSFSHNRMHSNNVDGIRFVDTTNATVTNNIFSENTRGVYLENSESIVFHHNRFQDHTRHARDNMGSENKWDDGFPSGGNFWSGYTGTDQFSGPSQNESGPDGIGDVPFVIDINSQDNYPLMSPLGSLPTAPQNLQATWDDSYVNITWSPPSSDGGFPVTIYRIYRGTAPGGEAYLAERPWLSQYNDTSVTNGVHYYYRVSAVNNLGEGPQSNEVASIPTAVPGPPTALQAVLSGDNREDVTVNWTLSNDDGMGQGSVIEYKVFRGSNYSSSGAGYQLIGNLPNGTSEFQDNLMGEGRPNNYFYRVCAVDVNNKTKCSEDQVGKSVRVLSKGPNLVSIPLVPVNNSTDDIMQSLSYDSLWHYDAVKREWKGHTKAKPYLVGFGSIDCATGLWINITQTSRLTVAGLVPTITTVQLIAGWNLIGLPSFEENLTFSQFFAETGVEGIEGFEGSAPPFYLKALGGTDVPIPGHAYWLRAPFDAQLTVCNF